MEITNNLLFEIPEDAFAGLERSLWELSLHRNELVEIPSRSLRYLKKLHKLDLSGNHISCVEIDSLRGLEDSLGDLNLAYNSISSLKPDSFAGLPNLESLDLSGNNLPQIDSSVFRDGMPRLAKLILADNVLSEIPYTALQPLFNLRTLDLSYNSIQHVKSDNSLFVESNSGRKLTLDTLHLAFNRITEIPTASFSNFDVINITYLDGNPIRSLGNEAFQPTKIRELYIRHCGLSYVSPSSFDVMGSNLQILDLTGNNITALPENFLRNFDQFK